MGFVNLDVPGEHEPPSSSTPILVYLDVCGGRRATSEVGCMFIHRSLQEEKKGGTAVLTGFLALVQAGRAFRSLFGACLPQGS